MLCSLWRNNIGDKGAAALAAILKETQISDLKCAATLSVFAFVSAPVDTLALLCVSAADTHLPSHCAPTHPSQYREQPHRSRGRLCACCHPQGDDDLQP